MELFEKKGWKIAEIGIRAFKKIVFENLRLIRRRTLCFIDAFQSSSLTIYSVL